MLMTNLKMDTPPQKNRAMPRNHVLGSKLQGSQMQTGDQTSDFLGPDTQAVDDWWTEKNHTSGSSCSASSTLESLMCLETSVQPLGSFFQLQAQRADAVCMSVCEQGSEWAQMGSVHATWGRESGGPDIPGRGKKLLTFTEERKNSGVRLEQMVQVTRRILHAGLGNWGTLWGKRAGRHEVVRQARGG